MANEADQADELTRMHDDIAIHTARQAAADMEKGTNGECMYCEDYFTRIVNGHCGHCRDLLGMK